MIRFRAAVYGLLTLVQLSLAASAAPQEPPGIVVERQRIVEKNARIELEPCQIEDCDDASVVVLQDTIEIRRSGWATIEFSGSVLVSFDRSIQVEERLNQLQIRLRGPGKLTAQLYDYLSKGYLWITTHTTLMGLVGTAVGVEVRRDGTTVLEVYEGEVRIFGDEPASIEDFEFKVGQGHRILFRPDGKRLLPSPLDPRGPTILLQQPDLAGPGDSGLVEDIIPRIFTRSP